MAVRRRSEFSEEQAQRRTAQADIAAGAGAVALVITFSGAPTFDSKTLIYKLLRTVAATFCHYIFRDHLNAK